MSKATERGFLAHHELPALLAVKFDDQLFVDISVDIFAPRQSGNRRAHIRAFGLRDPDRASTSGSGLPGTFDMRIFMAAVLNGHDIALLYLKGRDVHFFAVDLYMSVIDQLPGLAA